MRSVAAVLSLLAWAWIAADLFAVEPLIEPITSSPANNGGRIAPAMISPPIEIKLENVRWQALPEQIDSVVVSPDQRVWYIVRAPSSSPKIGQSEIRQVVQREFAKPSPQLQGVQCIFFETPGTTGQQRTKVKRVWMLCRESRECDLLLGYDGKQWIERRAKADYFLQNLPEIRSFFQLEDGVALLEHRGCHVLKGTNWIYQDLRDYKGQDYVNESRIWDDADGKGLTILIGRADKKLWRYYEGKWSEFSLPEQASVKIETRTVAKFEDHIYTRIGGPFVPRTPGADSAEDAALLRQKLGLLENPLVVRLGLDGKVDEIGGEELLTVGPYRIPLGSTMYNDPKGTFYAACQEVMLGERRLGPGMVICDLSGKASYVPTDAPEPLHLFHLPSVKAFSNGGKRVLHLFQLPSIKAFSNGGKRAWIAGRPAALWDMEKLARIEQLPDADFVVLAAMDDGTAFAGCPMQHSQLMVYRPSAADPRTTLAGETVKIHGPVYCIASNGCIWASRGDFGLEWFDGKTWHSCSGLVKDDQYENAKLEPYSLIPGQNGWVLSYLGFRMSDARRENGVILDNVLNPHYLFVNGEKGRWGGVSFGPWVSKHREDFLEAFSQPCPNRPWYASRPMVTRYVGNNRVVSSHLDVGGDGVVVDKDRNLWANSCGKVSVVSGTRVIDVSIPGSHGNPSEERLGIVDGIALLGDGEFVFLRLEDGNSYFARLKPQGDVEFVDGPRVIMDEYDHPVGTLRDQQGGLWVALRRSDGSRIENGRIKGAIACRMTTPDKGQDFHDIGEPELIDSSGCVWLAPRGGIGGDVITIWAPTDETSTLKVPGRKAGSPLAAGPKGVVFAQTTFGLQECLAKDPAKPGKYALGTVYRLETVEGESLRRLQYSSLGYLVATGYRESVEGSLMLHLYPLDQSRLKRDRAPAAGQPAPTGAGGLHEAKPDAPVKPTFP